MIKFIFVFFIDEKPLKPTHSPFKIYLICLNTISTSKSKILKKDETNRNFGTSKKIFFFMT
jgi:hypothetical protein